MVANPCSSILSLLAESILLPHLLIIMLILPLLFVKLHETASELCNKKTGELDVCVCLVMAATKPKNDFLTNVCLIKLEMCHMSLDKGT